jgi:hypothetical protein
MDQSLLSVPGSAVELVTAAQMYGQVTWLVERQGESLPDAVVGAALANVLDPSARLVTALHRGLLAG